MRMPAHVALLALGGILALALPPAAAQNIETVGAQALGMGGAFVAVASDGTASWWNPGGLAAGPFFDSSIGRGSEEPSPGSRANTTWFAIGTPPLGFSNYRFRLANLKSSDPTAGHRGNPDKDGGAVPVHAWQVSQWGLTLVQTLVPGVHAGATLKYVRGTVRIGVADAGLTGTALLDEAEVLSGGEVASHFDLDLGVLAVTGPVRLGALMRNLAEPEFGSGGPRLPRQLRVGAAFDAEAAGGPALLLSVDVDTLAYASASGERRIVAAGVEQWLGGRRIGVRAGVRQNQTGDRERVWTGGTSVRLGRSFYLDGYIVRGREAGEQGWGLATRVSY
jgi:hypothetical protein